MHVRLTLLTAARSAPLLAERFHEDRSLDQAGWYEVQRAAQALGPLAAAELRYCSPTPRSRDTGEALGLTPLAQPALRDCNNGAGCEPRSRLVDSHKFGCAQASEAP